MSKKFNLFFFLIMIIKKDQFKKQKKAVKLVEMPEMTDFTAC